LSRSGRSRVDDHVDEASEAELVAGLRSADPRAFDLVYARHRAPLFAFLVRLTGRRWLAEDLLQETWLRLARSATELPPDTRLRPWLFTVARNLFISHRRWAILDADRLRELGLWPGRKSDVETPLERAALSEAQRHLESALARLTLEHREVLLLCTVEQLAPSEAAEVLNITPEALRQRLSRARGILRKELEKKDRRTP
jgi:RNA polymerase sigma factor (sigma-70 family)